MAQKLALDLMPTVDGCLYSFIQPGANVSEANLEFVSKVMEVIKEGLGPLHSISRGYRDTWDRIRHNFRIAQALYGPQSA